MSKLVLAYSGYVCVPYLHNDDSLELKKAWTKSKNIEKLSFVTATFSTDSKPYFTDSANHYLLAKFRNGQQISKDLEIHNQEKTSFMFNIQDDLFEREVSGQTNFVSVYYMEYGEDGDDLQEIARLLLKRDKIEAAGFGDMNTFCLNPSKYTFPYSESIVVLEVGSEKSYQSVKKYCDQTRREINRKGMMMTNFMNLSILDHLK